MDLHLCEPHGSTRRYKCNFCSDFKTERKELYRVHLQVAHGREARLESKFLSYELMCNTCDFECFSASSYEYLKKHALINCPFREENLRRSAFLAKQSDIEPSSFIDYNRIMYNLLSPDYFDLISYEFTYRVKPVDLFIDKYQLFTHALTNSPLAVQVRRIEYEKLMLVKIYQMLIIERNNGTRETSPSILNNPGFKSLNWQPVLTKNTEKLSGIQENRTITVIFFNHTIQLTFISIIKCSFVLKPIQRNSQVNELRVPNILKKQANPVVTNSPIESMPCSKPKNIFRIVQTNNNNTNKNSVLVKTTTSNIPNAFPTARALISSSSKLSEISIYKLACHLCAVKFIVTGSDLTNVEKHLSTCHRVLDPERLRYMLNEFYIPKLGFRQRETTLKSSNTTDPLVSSGLSVLRPLGMVPIVESSQSAIVISQPKKLALINGKQYVIKAAQATSSSVIIPQQVYY
jgi:hypothetical protein